MKLKRHIITVVVLAGLTVGALSVRAEDHDMGKMPGMNMGRLKPSTAPKR